jgi:multisubunit Na+/H+ antiporter MnhB subunit
MMADILIGCTLILVALAWYPKPKPKPVMWAGNTLCVTIVVLITFWVLTSAKVI